MKHFYIVLLSVNWKARSYLNQNVFALLELADLFNVCEIPQLYYVFKLLNIYDYEGDFIKYNDHESWQDWEWPQANLESLIIMSLSNDTVIK